MDELDRQIALCLAARLGTAAVAYAERLSRWFSMKDGDDRAASWSAIAAAISAAGEADR